MSILKDIKKQQLQARKDKDTSKKGILTSLISVIGTKAIDLKRDLNDVEVQKEIIKFKKGVLENIEAIPVTDPRMDGFKKELELYESFLPQLLTKDELRKVLEVWKETNYPDSPTKGGTYGYVPQVDINWDMYPNEIIKSEAVKFLIDSFYYLKKNILTANEAYEYWIKKCNDQGIECSKSEVHEAYTACYGYGIEWEWENINGENDNKTN